MRRLFQSAVVVVGLLAVPRLADACSCMAESACRQYGNAGAVFAGEIVEVTAAPESGPPRPKIARMRVARAYKGAVQVGQVVAVEMPAGSSASCSLDVEPGARFVIYTGVEGGRFTTNLCRGSHGLQAGAPWPDLPPKSGAVSGTLARYTTGQSPVPVAGIDVWIVTPQRRITAKTDADGRFQLTGVPTGTWMFEFGVGPSEQADRAIELQSADDRADLFVPVRSRHR
jgi:hypothetical protein